MLTSAKLISGLQLQYQEGKTNQDANRLSRRPHAPEGKDDGVADGDDRVKQIVAQFTTVGQPPLSEAGVGAIYQRFQVCGLGSVMPL